ncbi:HBR202Cp [Eremothecium sinecaudum]|uniref:HBR202Cp n=1 Tax=Eremothecium sinecaudum TaxID=45286 RepID=A0A109UX59_9SACH|nr:HBR202Cp [Eremothecium sinecaudum]AMD19103.1 HBR202Cp [Eremothecium sinecaudum]
MKEAFSTNHYLRNRPLSSYNSSTTNGFLRRSHSQIEDSDDEKSLGPPKLSNFGSALLTDKENETPTYSHRGGASSQTTHTKPATLTSTVHTEDGSNSTLFTSVSRNQQSMTTMLPDHAIHTEDGLNSHRYQLIQQSLKDEVTSRQATRRIRRFINSRFSTLGPAKRNSTSTTNLDMSSNVSHDDSRDISQQDPNASSSSNNNSGILQNHDYNVFLDMETDSKLSKKEHDASSRSPLVAGNASVTGIDYGNVSFGDLNPYQYLKTHNLPTSELPNISRIYFEMQKRENRRAAVRKNIFTHSSAIKDSGDAISSYSNNNNNESNHNNNNNNSGNKAALNMAPKKDRQPRRKPSDASVSSFSKIQSSPMTGLSNYAQVQRQQTTQKNSIQSEDIPPGNPIKKREALNNLDVNANPQRSAFIKKHKRDSSHVNYGRDSEIPIVKKVEIVEPLRAPVTEVVPLKPSQSNEGYQHPQRRRQVIQVNGSEYEKIELLGRGGSSKVYKVRSTGNKVYALKRVSFDEFDDSSVDGFKGEIELLKKLENQTRVVKLIDHEMDHGVLYVVMECGDNDLSQVLAQRANMPLDIEFVRYHAQEMLKCVKVVHEAGIVHSDLKPANFVFVKGILKIIDFGIANAVPDHTVNIYRDTQIGTPNYMAPEALVAMNYATDQVSSQEDIHRNRWKVGKPSDIWSCGCIIYQMIYGRPPYGGFQGQNRLLAIMNPEVKIVYPERTSSGEVVPRTALDTIKACLERTPDKRWTVNELLNGSFIKPVSVTHFFIRDLIKNAVKYGSDQSYVSKEKVENLADDVWNRLNDFRL